LDIRDQSGALSGFDRLAAVAAALIERLPWLVWFFLPSDRRLSANDAGGITNGKTQERTIDLLKQPDWHDFGPTFASEGLPSAPAWLM